MSVYKEARIHCDWGGCGDYATERRWRSSQERNEPPTMTPAQIRRLAKRSGWRTFNAPGGRKDYCPRHASLAAAARVDNPSRI